MKTLKFTKEKMAAALANLTLYLDSLPAGKEYEITVKEYRQKRSLNANNYAWALITQIADILRKSKEEVYFQLLQDYGQSEVISVQSDIEIDGYFKYYKEIGNSRLQGKNFTHCRIYKGSSEFDTREMSIFLDGIIQEAEQLDIDTRTPEEIARMKDEWNTA